MGTFPALLIKVKNLEATHSITLVILEVRIFAENSFLFQSEQKS